jgi:RNA polymerase sigma factor (sigma-70 family)
MLDATFLDAYPLALRSARVRSAAAVARGYIPPADREDLEQGAITNVWLALPRYDPARAGIRTFVEVVISHQFTSMLRTHWRVLEFENLVGRCVGVDGGFREIETRIDVRRALANVTPFDRRVASSLTEYSVTETSQRLEVSRAEVYRAIGRLRRTLAEAGLSPWRRADPKRSSRPPPVEESSPASARQRRCVTACPLWALHATNKN